MSQLKATTAEIGRDVRLFVTVDWALLAAVFIAAIGLATIAAQPLWAASVAVILVTGTVLWRFHSQAAARRFGLANWVTLFRVNLVSLLLLAVWPGEAGSLQSWALFLIAAIALLLDGVDGWLARRRHEASEFGERFDMVADSAFTIITTLCLVTFGLVGAWILMIGLLRPAFVVAGRLWPTLAAPLPESRGRKMACAGSLTCLVAALAPPLAMLAPALALVALLQLVWSFGRDLRYLMHQKATP